MPQLVIVDNIDVSKNVAKKGILFDLVEPHLLDPLSVGAKASESDIDRMEMDSCVSVDS